MSDVVVIPFAFPGVSQVKCAFQTRIGGQSQGRYAGGNISFYVGDVDERVKWNRNSLIKVLGVRNIAFANQVHGKDIVFDPDIYNPPKCDGLATDKPGLCLALQTADCQPILLTDIDGLHICALHVGWKGNRIEFIKSGIADFCNKYDLIPSNVLVVRGPSLGPARSQFVNFDLEWGHDFEHWHDAKNQTVDLWQMTRDQLLMAGIAENHIYSLDLCTASLPNMFFSYRNDNDTGRQASVIWIE